MNFGKPIGNHTPGTTRPDHDEVVLLGLLARRRPIKITGIILAPILTERIVETRRVESVRRIFVVFRIPEQLSQQLQEQKRRRLAVGDGRVDVAGLRQILRCPDHDRTNGVNKLSFVLNANNKIITKLFSIGCLTLPLD